MSSKRLRVSISSTMERETCLVIIVLAFTGGSHVIADEPPDIQSPRPADIPPVYFKLHSTLVLPCSAIGLPTPTYKWMKDGEDINSNERYIRELKEGYIEIQRLTSTDEGDYQCVATNKWGSAVSQVFQLRMASLGHFQDCEAGKHYERQLWQYLNVTRGNISSTPPPVYTWWVASSASGDNIRRVKHDQRVIQDLEGNLYFTSLLPEDVLPKQQVYRLEALNMVTGERATGCDTVVTVNQDAKPEGRPIMIYKSDDVVHVLDGEMLKIQCIFIGSRNIDVSWSGPTTEYTTEEAGTVLVVFSMSSSAEGKYTCTGTNVYDHSSHFITVVMQELPKFTEGGKPVKQTVPETETAIFTCQTKPNLKAPVTTEWMINGQPLSNLDDRLRGPIMVDDNGHRLVIDSLIRDEDMMVVQCKVSNKYGTLYANGPLVVLVPAKAGLLAGFEWTICLVVPLVLAVGVVVCCIAWKRHQHVWRVNEATVAPKPEHKLDTLIQLLQLDIEIIDLTKENRACDLYVNCAQGPYDLINPKDIQNPDTPVEEVKKDGDCEYIDQSEVEPRRHKLNMASIPAVPKRKQKMQEQKEDKSATDPYLVMEGEVHPDVPKVKQDSPYLMPRDYHPQKTTPVAGTL